MHEDNVVGLRGRLGELPPPGQIKEEMISKLRELLAAAERGEVSGFALAWLDGGQGFRTGFWSVHHLSMLGALQILQSDMLAAAAEEGG